MDAEELHDSQAEPVRSNVVGIGRRGVEMYRYACVSNVCIVRVVWCVWYGMYVLVSRMYICIVCMYVCMCGMVCVVWCACIGVSNVCMYCNGMCGMVCMYVL